MDNCILTEYQISAERMLTIVLLADLHQSGTKQMIELVKSANPNLICIAGDTFERCEKNKDRTFNEMWNKTDCGKFYGITRKLLTLMDHVFKIFAPKNKINKKVQTEQTYDFLQTLQKVAPVYMSLGNHDQYLTRKDREILEETGIVLLDNNAVKIKNMRIGGLSSVPNWDWLEEYCKMDGYKILLSHHPERFPYFHNIDLILSGHAHGGQIRIKGQGIYSPDQGLLPKYTKGVYENESGKMVVSTGCSNTASIPRWGNPCEVVVIHLGCA